MLDPVVTADAGALPGVRYRAGVARGDWDADPAQLPALAELDRIHAALLEPPSRGLLQRLRKQPPAAVPGLYLWGGVGRGKTFLVDLFYDGLPIQAKHRTHFHRFMRDVHARLREHAGERDPLASIAHAAGRRWRVLVLDEFFVTDIGDAMLLGRFMEQLFANGVALVTTSNTAPQNLFKDGLQRESFLPAIAQIQQHCHILELVSDQDYRLRALTRSPVYRAPLDAAADEWLATRWKQIIADAPREDGPLHIEGRDIPVRGIAGGHIWFDFDALCDGPRATGDYIEIATRFHTVLVGGVPVFDGSNDDPGRRFVNLIDELYDRNVNLVCTADADPVGLYTGHRLAGPFERTTSRLIEMRSTEYLTTRHRGGSGG
ncbi:cell division protein ZapE [Novilysobacter avium]|uniref:AFG1 family ATPase n=1 Tax=Novilysobacter avium TaxID=2781023 RepID=A0A7S6UKL3_9GAMM|nr:cell division protein ZapE [Lysobacter avium]QOW22043.1 AFG1 family ATPase [Lysobacter avium]